MTARIAFISATVATVLGTMAAIALTRYTDFRGRILFTGMIFAPLVNKCGEVQRLRDEQAAMRG